MISLSALARYAPVIGFCVLVSTAATPALSNDEVGVDVVERSFFGVKGNLAVGRSNRVLSLRGNVEDAGSNQPALGGTSKASQRWAARLEEWRKRREEFRAKRKARLDGKKKSVAPQKKQAKQPAKTGINGLIAKYAKQHGVPYSLARAVVQVESTFRPNVTGGAGEIGLMQIKLSTARGMGYKGSRKGLYDPATNLYWGMKYLGKARRLAGGSTCGTILRYNAGHGAKRMNPVSSRYCSKVRRILT